MSADECEFFSQDYCCPPDYIVKAGFVCPICGDPFRKVRGLWRTTRFMVRSDGTIYYLAALMLYGFMII